MNTRLALVLGAVVVGVVAIVVAWRLGGHVEW